MRGLVATLDPEPGFAAGWVVSAHDLVVAVASQIPASDYSFNGGRAVDRGQVEIPVGPMSRLHVAPMGPDAGPLDSPLRVTVHRAGTNPPDLQGMQLTAVCKTVPAALWGAPVRRGEKPAVDGDAHVRDTLAGFELRPPIRAAPRATAVPRSALAYTEIPEQGPAVAAVPGRPVRVGSGVPVDEAARVRARAELLRGVLIDPGEVRPGPDPGGMFLATPTVVAWEVRP